MVKKYERAFVMPSLYTRVLKAVFKLHQDVRLRKRVRIQQLIMSAAALADTLMRTMDNLKQRECRAILRTLHDLGYVLWYDDRILGAGEDTIIIDPTLVLYFVREVINHSVETAEGHPDYDALYAHGEMKHSLLVAFNLWRDLSASQLLFFKKLLQFYRLAYPMGGERRAWRATRISSCRFTGRASASPMMWRLGRAPPLQTH